MQAYVTTVREATAAAIAEAGGVLRAGGLIAFPTETVYGLGADATRGTAVAAIFALKKRPRINPLIVHFKNRAQAAEHVAFSAAAMALAEAFWPGPLTLVLPRRSDTPLSLLVSAGLDTVAVRAPSHPVARALIDAAGVPLAAPSANPSGAVSPTTAAHVAEGFAGKVTVLDGGAAPIGIESTVIGFSPEGPVMLRPGGTPRGEIERVMGCPLLAPAPHGPNSSPGMLSSHYAPRARLRRNATHAEPGEVLLAFGPEAPAGATNLSATGSLAEAAANLFAMLRQLDRQGDAIAVMPIPASGLGEAINDRLKRAAAPRDGKDGPHV